MSEGIIISESFWHCGCGVLNFNDQNLCGECGKERTLDPGEGEKEEEDEKIPSMTENMNLRFPRRIIPY